MTRRTFLNRSGAMALGVAAVTQSKGHATQTRSSQSRGKSAKQKVTTDRAPKPAGPYSQAIVATNSGTIYVAGQIPRDPRTNQNVTGSFEAQAVQVFENIKAILEAAGASMADVVKVNVYLTDLNNFAKLNEIYPRYFPEPFPVRTTVGAQLAAGLLIEVDCIAVRGS